jgi:hypothetical protein
MEVAPLLARVREQLKHEADYRAEARAAARAGFISTADPAPQSQAMVAMMLAAGEPLRHAGRYDFERSDLFGCLFSQGKAQFLGEGFARTPPPDLLFLQRKFIGTFLLCVRLKAKVDLAQAFAPHL